MVLHNLGLRVVEAERQEACEGDLKRDPKEAPKGSPKGPPKGLIERLLRGS